MKYSVLKKRSNRHINTDVSL